MNNEEKKYGTKKVLYGVVERQEGRIELRVYHRHKGVRAMIENHLSHPYYFFDNLQLLAEPRVRAKYWLARLVIDYPGYFKKGRVDIVLT